MGRKRRDEEDISEYGKHNYRPSRFRWSAGKIVFVLLLFGGSFALCFLGVYPLIDGDFELKSFANILFVVLQIFYLVSFAAVKKNSHFVFWTASLLMLDAVTLSFYFYDEIFF